MSATFGYKDRQDQARGKSERKPHFRTLGNFMKS